jgi:hypothetical protein
MDDTATTDDGATTDHEALRRRLARARRTNWVVAALAAVVLAGTLAVGAVDGEGGSTPRPPDDRAEAAASSSAERIVAELGDEPIDPHEVELVASVRRFDSCDALLGELQRTGAGHVGSRGFGGDLWGGPYPYGVGLSAEDSAGDMAQSAARSGAGGDGDGGETLGTNVIVAGVDEPDTVKATGTLIVELNGPVLRVIDTEFAQVVGTLGLLERSEEGDRVAHPSSLLVEGDRAVVFGDESVAAEPIPGDPSASRPHHRFLTVTFIDLSDPAAPKVTDRARIEGGLAAVRRVGDQVRMVTSSSLADLPMVMPTTPSSVSPALHQNRLAVAGSSVDDWIPTWDTGHGSEAQRLMDCGQVVVPDTFAGVHMTSLVQFDLDGPFEPRATGLLAPAELLTATATDVVVASQIWVDPVDRKDDFSDWATALHHFSFGAPEQDTAPQYLASGAVDGSIRDDFSLSVLADGTVAAVTVDVLPWQSRGSADITVRLLDAAAGSEELTQVGAIVPEGSGTGVAGVRFAGDRLLVSSGLAGTTLSVVDLTDRTAPADRGVVSMRGSGAYLHPLEDGRVLAIGSWRRNEGEDFTGGLHATLLDLRAAPAVAGEWALEGAYSSVEGDHHAFTWWASRSLAAFGITHSHEDRLEAPDALLLGVDAAGLTPRLVDPTEADLGPRCAPLQQDRRNCDDTGPPWVQRVLIVDGAPWLYTSESVERLDPTTFASLGVVPLRPPWQ